VGEEKGSKTGHNGMLLKKGREKTQVRATPINHDRRTGKGLEVSRNPEKKDQVFGSPPVGLVAYTLAPGRGE